MGLFDNKEVVVLKEQENLQAQIEKLTELAQKATGSLKSEIEKQIRFLEFGLKGEDEILFQLKYADMDMFVLRDLYLENDGLTAQIDYFVVTPKKIFIIECKNLSGNITINNRGDFIRSYTYKGKKYEEGIESPITQNERHMLVLKNLRKSGFKSSIMKFLADKVLENDFIPLVVLANSKTIVNDRYAPKEVKSKVIRADQLGATMRKICSESNNQKSNKKEMKSIAENWMEVHNSECFDYSAKYAEQVEQQCKANQKADESDVCPRCGARLVKRNGKNGEFIGCSSFPKCRYTKNIE